VARLARLFAPVAVLLVAAMRLIGPRAARRLDAAERPAKFLNLALVGELLAFGEFDEFENFVELVKRVLERLRDFCRVDHRLVDGRGFRRAKISGPGPGSLARRLRAALFGPGRTFGTTFPFGFRRRGIFRDWFSG
jgi:hypothetical protein